MEVKMNAADNNGILFMVWVTENIGERHREAQHHQMKPVRQAGETLSRRSISCQNESCDTRHLCPEIRALAPNVHLGAGLDPLPKLTVSDESYAAPPLFFNDTISKNA